MKKFLFTLGLFCFLAFTASAQATAIDEFYQKYADDERFSVIYISPRLFGMFGDMDLDLDDDESEVVMSFAKNLKGLKIITTDETPQKFYEEAKKAISTKGYEPLIYIKGKGSDSDLELLIKEENNKIIEVLMLAGGSNDDDDFLLMSFIGDLTEEDIQKLAKEIKEDR
ncbi:MAG: DUF4252 domain-containing protein [Bacteroidota bacterium]